MIPRPSKFEHKTTAKELGYFFWSWNSSPKSKRESHSMCFYDQYIYHCGDFEWGQLRLHCRREYRTWETCGMKLVMEHKPLGRSCQKCQFLKTKYSLKAEEDENIKHAIVMNVGPWEQNHGSVGSQEIAPDLMTRTLVTSSPSMASSSCAAEFSLSLTNTRLMPSLKTFISSSESLERVGSLISPYVKFYH